MFTTNMPEHFKEAIRKLGPVRATSCGLLSSEEIADSLPMSFPKDSPHEFITVDTQHGTSIAFIGNTENSENIALILENIWNYLLQEIENEQA